MCMRHAPLALPLRETTHTSWSLKQKKPHWLAGQPERPAGKRQEMGANEGEWSAGRTTDEGHCGQG